MKAQATNQPALTVDSNLRGSLVGVTVRNLEPDLAAALDRYTQAGGLLQPLLRVSVVLTEAPNGGNLPDIFGRYQLLQDGLRFIPYFPFEPGLCYQASFDPRPLCRPEFSEVLTFDFSLPKPPSPLPPKVQHIFPSGDCLPENLLRFYVGFSTSMQRGRAETEIALLGLDGEPAPDVLYRAPVELWDRSMQFLTILLDPGRLKRGVGPNRKRGPPLKIDQVYTLAIGAGMQDLSGCQLAETVYKRFFVTEPIREPIAVEQWKIAPPLSQSREPLVLRFPRSLDWALLLQAITTRSADGSLIDGQVVVDRSETRWSFIPKSPWTAGPYQVRVASSLEDVCGNNVIAAFDRPLRSGNDLPYELGNRSIAFHVV